MNFYEQLNQEIKYLNHNELIDIRNIILENQKEILTESKQGLVIDINNMNFECRKKIASYIEKIYVDLDRYRKKNGMDYNTLFTFSIN